MLMIENIKTYGWEAAIRGMRNPMNSWDKSDSGCTWDHMVYVGAADRVETYQWVEEDQGNFIYGIGPNDQKLMESLVKGGPVHAKFRRMINITMDITAPLYWWKEFDTYKIGTVANSCSTMHKIQAKEFTLQDFSCEHLLSTSDLLEDERYKDIKDLHVFTAVDVEGNECYYTPKYFISMTCDILNHYRTLFLKTNDKKYWWQMIQLLPSSYNQRRTVQLNYEVAAHIYHDRKDHKLDEWRTLCDVFELVLPYSRLITNDKGE